MGWLVFTGVMNNTLTDKLAASRERIQGFGAHYDYDVSYIEELMEVSPGAFQAFEGAMPMAQVRKAAQVEAIMIAKLTTARAEDCGPCLALGVKMAREAGVPNEVIRGVLKGGEGLSAEQRDLHRYARAVAVNEGMDEGVFARVEARWGREVMAELAVNIIATRMYPTMKRALGYAKSCALMPELVA